MFGVPVPRAVLPALVRDRPNRTSRSDRVESVRVTPSASCWLSTFDEGVARAARLAGDRRRLEVVHLAVAEAARSAGPAAELLVNLDVDLVVVVGAAPAGCRSCSRCRRASARAAPPAPAGERRDRRCRNDAAGIDRAGQRIADRLAHDALTLRHGRDAGERHACSTSAGSLRSRRRRRPGSAPSGRRTRRRTDCGSSFGLPPWPA